jgi:hypothetical protein
MPTFLACVGDAHGRAEGTNVCEEARTAEVWARTTEGGGGVHVLGGHERPRGGGAHTVQRRARTAWGDAHGKGLAWLHGVGAGRGVWGVWGVWGVCFFIISFGFFFA